MVLKQKWNVVEIVTDEFRKSTYVAEGNPDRPFSKRMDKFYSIGRTNTEYFTIWGIVTGKQVKEGS